MSTDGERAWENVADVLEPAAFADAIFAGEPWTHTSLTKAITERDRGREAGAGREDGLPLENETYGRRLFDFLVKRERSEPRVAAPDSCEVCGHRVTQHGFSSVWGHCYENDCYCFRPEPVPAAPEESGND